LKRTLLIVLIGLTTAYSAFAQQSISLSFSGPTNWTPGTSIVLNTTDSFLNFGGSYDLNYWLQAQNAIEPSGTVDSDADQTGMRHCVELRSAERQQASNY
jgi:hypothetical protein